MYFSAFEYFDLIAKGCSLLSFARVFERNLVALGSCIELPAIHSMMYTKARPTINVDATDITFYLRRRLKIDVFRPRKEVTYTRKANRMENNNQQPTAVSNASANAPDQTCGSSNRAAYKRTPSSARERIAAKIAKTKGVGVKARGVM